MRYLGPFVISLVLPAFADAYSYAFLRENGKITDPRTVRVEYNSTEPSPCRVINYSLDTGLVIGMKLWTNTDLGRGPWAFLFYADSQHCDHHANIPVLVVYCNKPVKNPFTLQLADFEPLTALMKGSTAMIWKLRSWEEIKPRTRKWRLFIEDLNLVPGQMAFDSTGRWGDDLLPVDPEIGRVKMWATPTDRFDRPQTVLKDSKAMEEILGEEFGFDRYSRGIDEAPFLTNQPTMEKWARIFAFGDINPKELVGPDPRAVVGQPTTEKWAGIFEIGDVSVPVVEGFESPGWGDDMELEESEDGWRSMGIVPGNMIDQKLEGGGLDGSVRPEHGSEDEVPVEIKIENNEVDWFSDNQEDSEERNTPPSNLNIPGPGGINPTIEIERKNEEPVDTKEEPLSIMAERARSAISEPVEKIETTSEAVEGNQYLLPVEETANEVDSEKQDIPQSRIEEESPNSADMDYQSIISELIGSKPSRPLREFTSIPLQAVPGLGKANQGFAIGLSDHLQRQYAIADQGIRELGRSEWDWNNKRQMGRIVNELTSSPESRKSTARKRLKKLPRWKKTQSSLGERLMYQIAAADDGEEQESLFENESPRTARREKNLKKSQQEIELSTIRIRGDPTVGSPPHALAFFTGTECYDTTVSVITRFFQISDRVEQSISPFAVRGSLTEGPEWDRNLIAPKLYNYYESVGYTSTLWGAIVDLELEPGDMAFKYASLDGSLNEWRVATAVIAMEEEPDVVGADSMLPLAYFARKLSISLPEMAEDERKLTSAHFQKIAEERPAEEKVLIVENPALIDPESVWRNRLVHDHERKIKIGKLARAANNYGPAPIRKNNPSMIELNPLVNLVGQSNLEDIERKRELTVEEHLNDRDWDLYLPESKLKV
ncbi:hypothetical protein TWF703_010795 [Orbilia oligospora]|uniref:Uncharacterized protein n=1 Tax=Orbilia oligospora TaxID=2813651 RepID=A0A7C8P282_ORBOL|nr:hypothetical protein TWF703_010795 [Orbilia oligospora]